MIQLTRKHREPAVTGWSLLIAATPLVAKIKSNYIGLAVICNRGMYIISTVLHDLNLSWRNIRWKFYKKMGDSSGDKFTPKETIVAKRALTLLSVSIIFLNLMK